tara:strand:- start:235 stop:720 length:486 start_codon:yes stop_codon:yes gene_type:complete
MKKFKELASFLKENEYTDSSEPIRVARSDYGVFRVEDKHSLGRVNALIHEFTKREFVDPKQGMAQLRHKLNLIGLDFEMAAYDRIDEGSQDYKVNRFGGEFGVTPDHDLSAGFYKSDGISPFNDGVGMVLRTTFTVSESGLYNIEAMIVPDVDEEGDDDDI